MVMKALVLEDYNRLIYKDVPIPQINEDEALVEVKATSICGSDVHGYDGKSGRRIPPIIMGHEASGVIAQVGSKVKGFKIGDRVTFDSTINCGKCSFCATGSTNLCNRRKVFGVSCQEYKRDGTFAEYIAVPGRILYSIPECVSYESAALVEPLSVALHAIKISRLSIGDSVLVIGAGTIGLMLIKLLKISGASQVFVSDPDERKLSIAKQIGADYCFGKDGDMVFEIKKLISDGVDIAFEAVGINTTVQNAIISTRKGGTVTLIGNISPEVKLPLQTVSSREIRLLGSCASAGEYPICISLLEHEKVNMEGIISETAPLKEGQKWIDRLHTSETGLVKVILVP